MIKQIIITGCLIFGICLTSCNKQTQSVSNSNKIIKQKNQKQGEIFTVNTKIKDIINDPAFKGYGRLIFPVDIKIKNNLKLQDEEEILPWYSEIQPKRSAEIINYMKQQVNNGNQIFYNIYSEEEKKKDSDKRNTGLFFFRGLKQHAKIWQGLLLFYMNTKKNFRLIWKIILYGVDLQEQEWQCGLDLTEQVILAKNLTKDKER